MGICNTTIDKFFNVPTSQNKWCDILGGQNIDWNLAYLSPLKSCLSTKIRYFQYKLLHRILGVNTYTSRIGLTNNNLCSFCLTEEETIIHLFWDCTITKQFINDIQNDILHNVNINCISFLFGTDENELYINFVFLYAKYFIFMKKM